MRNASLLSDDDDDNQFRCECARGEKVDDWASMMGRKGLGFFERISLFLIALPFIIFSSSSKSTLIWTFHFFYYCFLHDTSSFKTSCPSSLPLLLLVFFPFANNVCCCVLYMLFTDGFAFFYSFIIFFVNLNVMDSRFYLEIWSVYLLTRAYQNAVVEDFPKKSQIFLVILNENSCFFVFKAVDDFL